MPQFLAPILNTQIENSNGAPLSGGTVEVYLAGTSTPAATTSDKAGLVPNTNPIVLNTLGLNNQGAVWLTGGAFYKFIIKDSVGIVQRTIDNISGINDTTFAVDQWIVYQGAPTFVSTTSFTVAGDQTSIFQVGRRVKTTNTGGTVYSTITGSSYSAPNTTVTVANDSGVLDSGISQVSYGIISVLDTSLPGGAINYGQCRLVKTGANLVLTPFNGNRISVNGQICTIPGAGVSLAPTALVVSTLYYIYAYLNGTALSLEASTTGHSTQATTGVEIKTGDPTRTLVGMARPIAGPAWQSTTNQQFVISWFNQRPLQLQSVLASGTGVAFAAYGEISTSLRNEFLVWNGGVVQATFQGTATISLINSVASTTLPLDSTSGTYESFSSAQAYAANAFVNPYCSLTVLPTEGYHLISPLAQATGGATITYGGSGTPGNRCVNSAVIQG